MTAPAHLSETFQRPPYLAAPQWRPRYVGSRQRATCDECFALQHEADREPGPRATVRIVRTLPDGTRLRLCTAHAELWKAADTASTTHQPTMRSTR